MDGLLVSADDKYRKGTTAASLLPSSADKINIKGAFFNPSCRLNACRVFAQSTSKLVRILDSNFTLTNA